jgi:hypothetical protein
MWSVTWSSLFTTRAAATLKARRRLRIARSIGVLEGESGQTPQKTEAAKDRLLVGPLHIACLHVVMLTKG